MEQLQLTFEGVKNLTHSVRTGNVGSGDLEVVLLPTNKKKTSVFINTSVDHHGHLWQEVLERSLGKKSPLMHVIINDFGATPGVVSLRMEQALEQIDGKLSKPYGGKFGVSFIELNARARAQYLLDPGTAREILGPEDNLTSPWLVPQGVVPQSDDGCVVMKGKLNKKEVVVIAVEGIFQGGAIGEVSGAKIASALDLAFRDNQAGKKLPVILLLETGGVRLQEANLGLGAISEIHSGIVAVRAHAPVIAVVAGTVGCFGGMSIAAGLCSKVIVTAEARLGLNGPAVIEQEAGLEEYNSRDRAFIWGVTGGEQRFETGFADLLVEDDADLIKATLVKELAAKPQEARCEQIDRYRAILKKINKEEQSTPELARQFFKNKKESKHE